MSTSNREWIVASVALAIVFPATVAAETYHFRITDKGECVRDEGKDFRDPATEVVVNLVRPPGVAKEVVLELRPEDKGPVTTIAAQPGATAGAINWKVEKPKLGPTLVIVDPRNAATLCPMVPNPNAPPGDDQDKRALAGGAPVGAPKVEDAAWWQEEGATALSRLRGGSEYPRGTQFLVHYDTGAPAAPFPASVSERSPIQVVVITRPGATPDLMLSVTKCEAVLPFRISGKPAGTLQGATKALPPPALLVAFGPLLRCGAGTLEYSLAAAGSPAVPLSIRVRSVTHLAFTVAYGFDFTRVPTYGVEAGAVTRTTDRAGMGLRLGFTWFPLGIDYEDMRWFNYVNPMFAVDPEAPTENLLVGAAFTPTGGLALLVGANFRRLPILNGVAVGDPLAGTGVPTRMAWGNDGIGLFLGLSVDDDLFEAIKGRMGR